MRFKSVTIQNFLSIKNANIELENQGLTLINGRNLDNEALNNNGAGKSSIIEGIVYAIYGKTLRGIKGDAVVNNVANNNTKIFLDLVDDDGTQYRIARYRKHSTNKNKSFLYRNGVDITPKSEADFNDAVAKLLQMDYLTFTSSILYSAESFKFTSATDSEMKSTFDTMLGLDVLTRCLEVTKLRLKHIESVISNKNLDLEELDTRLEDVKKEIAEDEESKIDYQEELQDKIDDAEELKDKTIQDLEELKTKQAQQETDLDTLKANVDTLKKELEEARAKAKQVLKLRQVLSDTKSEINTYKRENSSLERQISSISSKINLESKKIEKLETKVDGYNKAKLELDDTIGNPCPTCGQPLTKESLEPAKKEYDEKISQCREEIKCISDTIEEYSKESTACKETMSENDKIIVELTEDKEKYESLIEKSQSIVDSSEIKEKEYDEAKQLLGDKQVEIKVTSVEIQSAIESINKLTREIKSMELDESNSFDVTIARNKAKQVDLLKKQKELSQELIDLVDQRDCLEFWQKAYSNQGIKSYILDSITPYLNRRVNKYLSKLANNQIEVKFSTQTQLKSGEKREKFSLDIINKDGGTGYISNSGGERRRIDIAVNLALIDLVASRSNKKLNLAIFDEVFDTLDNTGVEKVIELLQEISKEKSSIFVISHNDHLKSYFDNIITIVKKNGCSVIK